MRAVEQLTMLVGMGPGLLNRLYLLKSDAVAKNKAPCLSDADVGRVRGKLEKYFPALPDTLKLQGWDQFSAMAGAVVDQLQGAYSLLLDVADFCTRAREAMRVLLTDTVEFKLSQNRCLIHLYLDTLVVYIRVLKLTQMLDDRAALAALYAAAYGVLHQAELSSAPAAAAFQHSTSCVAALLHATADNARHLIDTFAPQVDHFKTLLMTLRPSLCLLQNPEDLRRNYILNPITGGDNMGAPAIEPLSASLDVPALSELQQLDRTYEHTAYSFLAYPALLLQPDAFELLGLLGRGRLSVVLWRDISLSFHVELEKISQSFPLPADGIQVPRGVKLKSLLKAASRTSVAEAGQQMRFRRSYLEAELATLTSLLCAVPGLMGPKLPTLLAACSLARGEVCAYFRHAEGTTLRRDSRAHFRAAQYAAEDVGLLMHLLGVAAGLINTHRGIISAYYGEYLCANDLTVVGRLIGECGDALDTARPLFDAVLRDLDQLGKSPTTWARPSHLSHSEGGSGVDAVGGLAAFRFNWQCAVAICCSQQCSAGRRACAPFALLAARMQYATERSTYKDSLTRLLDECVHLTPAGWYRAALLSSFSATLADPHLGAAHSFAFFSPLQHALQSCHPDCPAEVPELSQKAGVIANTMMADLAAFAVTLVKFLWDNISALERQHQPLEVAKRIERSLKKGAGTGGPAPAEVLPGCESEVWAKHLIERFVLIQQHLTWIMAAARTKGAFIVHDVEYVPALYLQEQIVVFFQQRLQELMSSMVNVDGMGGGVGTGEEVGGPGTLGFGQLLHKLTCGFRSMQYVLRFVGTDVGSGVRGVFAWETRADGTSPIGVPLTLFQELDGTRLIGRVAEFVSLLTLQVAKEGSGLVWSPVQGAFVNRGMEQGGGGLHGDRLLNPYELRQLVIIVGVQGVRAIESRLLSIVADQIAPIIRFLRDNKVFLLDLQSSYCLSLLSAERCASHAALMGALRTVGAALVVREMLRTAVGAVCTLRFGDMHAAVGAAMAAADFYTHPSLVSMLACLGSDLGLTEERDLSLVSAMAQLNLAADRDCLALLPAAGATLFASAVYDHSTYLPRIGAFEGNEHLVQVALAKLFSVFFKLGGLGGLNTGVGGDDEGGKGAVGVGVGVVANRQQERERYQTYVEQYVRFSSQILLKQREEVQGAKGGLRPTRTMGAMLEYFTTLCPVTTRGCLERSLPNSLLHADLVDVTLGRQRHADKLGTFQHPSSASAPDEPAAQEQF